MLLKGQCRLAGYNLLLSVTPETGLAPVPGPPSSYDGVRHGDEEEGSEQSRSRLAAGEMSGRRPGLGKYKAGRCGGQSGQIQTESEVGW